MRVKGNIVKCEKTILGDFEDGFVQPVKQSGTSQAGYKAVAAGNMFRVANVLGHSANHTQGVVLTTNLLHKLHSGTVDAMYKPVHSMPAARSPGFRGGGRASQTKSSPSHGRSSAASAGGNTKRDDEYGGGGGGSGYPVTTVMDELSMEDVAAGSPSKKLKMETIRYSKKHYKYSIGTRRGVRRGGGGRHNM